jgi:putative transposase
MVRATDFRTGRHVVYNIQAHLVVVPKYRRAVINERVLAVLKTAWQQICTDFECELREVGWEADHVHLLVGYPPKVALSKLVNSLKGVSARRLRAANFPEVRNKLWGEHFWSPSYCCGVLRRSPARETVKRYIQAQRGQASSPT